MLALALLLAASSVAPQHGDAPKLAGTNFQIFSRQATASCKSKRLTQIAPADLLDLEEQFTDGLGTADKRAWRRANQSPALRNCSQTNGASCVAIRNLEALRRSGMMSRFVRQACTTYSR
jgi:hypothetical protein